jgi:ABC-type amino acid transport substrate-binding protein
LQLLAVHDYEMALKMLNESLAEAILADDTILRGLMRGLPGQYRMIDEKLTYEPYAVAVTSGHTRLLAEINKAIDQFKSSGE